MKSLIKLFIALLLFVAMTVQCMAYDFSAVCESGQTLYYNITSSSSPYQVEVTYQSSTDNSSYLSGSLTIPSTVTSYNGNTYSVTGIGNNAFSGCSGLTSVTIPNSVKVIGIHAFLGCSGLTSVTIGTGITSIGVGAFANCSGLTSVTIPNSITSIGRYAFSWTGWYDNQSDGVLYLSGWCLGYKGSSPTGSLEIQQGTIGIASYAFYECSGLTSVTIPNSVTSIGESAFNGCNSLQGNEYDNAYYLGNEDNQFVVLFKASSTDITSCNINTSCKFIYESAFSECSSLTSVIIPNSVTSIAYEAFYDCYSLTSVTIPNSVTSIGGWAFSGCSGLTELSMGESVENIGNFAFYSCSGLTTVNFNATNCTTMGSSSYPVFENCNANAAINIGEGVITIPDYAFKGLFVDGTLAIPSSVTSIGREAFAGCGLSGSLTIPNSVTSIGQSAFSGCRRLVEMTIPFVGGSASTTASESTLFGYIFGTSSYDGGTPVDQYDGTTHQQYQWNGSGYNLVNVANYYTYYIPDSLRSVSVSGGNLLYGAFYGCSMLSTVTVGNSVTSIGQKAFYGCSGLTTLNYNAINCATFGNNNGLTGNTAITAINIGENVSSIPAGAFKNCTALAEVNFNALNCSTMGSSSNPVFNGCSSLATLNIGDGVTNIPANAFSGCSGLLGALTIPNSTTSIGENAFYNCSGFTSLVTGESLASIGASAFEGCSAVRTMTLGSNVVTIGNRAFAGCTGLFMATVKPELPPMAHAETFENVSTTAVIKVPCGSVPYYNAAQYWNVFTNVQGDMVYTLTVGSSDDIMGYATVVSAPTCNNPSGVISATAYDRYRFDSWNDGNTENPRTVTLTSDANYIANFASLYPTVYNSFEAEACGSYTWNGQTYTESGYYQQTFTAANSADSIVTLTLTIHAMPIPTIAQSGTLDACNPSIVTLSVGNYSTYQWSNGATTATVEISTPGYYFVEVSDAYGCTGISEQTNIGLSNNLPEAPQISVVGMNSENHNVVAWSALDNANVNGYNIYREDNVADVYELVANVDASADTYWTDETADPSARAYRYKVTAFDQCGGESPMSDYHKTMHLTINQGLGNTWNLIWSHYEGFNFGTYRIYRGTSPSNMTMIGEVPSNLNSYTDNTATDNTGFYYQVEVVRNSRSRDAEISSRSNIVDNGIFPEYTITVMSANPNRGTVTGGGTYPEGAVITIEAIANEGFEFASWNDENTDNPRQITVTADATYIASFDPATGIEENASLEIALFPNPANDILNITSSETISEIEIVNTLGQVVKRIEVNSDNAVCDVEELTNGVYIIRVHGPEMASVICQRKFIKE